MSVITKPSHSTLAASPEALRPFLEALATRVGGGSNWVIRKKIVIDLLLGLDEFFALPEAEREVMLRAGTSDGAIPAGATDIVGPEDGSLTLPDQGVDTQTFGRLLPAYVGAILEGLDEGQITTPDQAAIYYLSVHPEHHLAAQDWIAASPRNLREARRVMKGDRRYRKLAVRAGEHWQRLSSAIEDS